MPQGSGYMNTAPPPIPGGFGNPAGANLGLPNASLPGGIPPAFGGVPMTTSPTNPLPQGVQAPPGFPANTAGTTPTNMQGLSSGMTGLLDPKNEHYARVAFSQAYGKGIGDMIYNILSKGLFNPEVANALINAMQPSRARGANDVTNAFGGMGARFSSAAAIGLGDFESQFALQEQQVLASLFQHDQDLQVNLLENMLPTLHTEEANRNTGWFQKFMGYLEAGSGIVSNLTGGSGGSSIAAGNKNIFGDSSVPSSPTGSVPMSQDAFNSILGIPSGGMPTGATGTLQDLSLQNSAASSVTGSTDGTPGGQDAQFIALLKKLGIDPGMMAVMGGK